MRDVGLDFPELSQDCANASLVGRTHPTDLWHVAAVEEDVGGSLAGESIFARAQETTCASMSGIGANPCIKASGATPNSGTAFS